MHSSLLQEECNIGPIVLSLTEEKMKFSMRVSSVNVTKCDQETADLVRFIEEIHNAKLHFLCSGFQYCILRLIKNNWISVAGKMSIS